MEIINDAEIARVFFNRLPINILNNNFFHSPPYFSLLQNSSNPHPLIISFNPSGEFTYILCCNYFPSNPITKKLTSRSIITGGPLGTQDHAINPSHVDVILNQIVKHLSSSTIYVEFRNLFDLSLLYPVFRKYKFKFKNHYNYQIRIKDNQSNWNNLSQSRRRQINKSLQSGTEIIQYPSLSEIKEFYHILKRLYRLKVKKPIPSWKFFLKFYEESKKGNHGKYFLVKFKNKIVAGILCPIHEKKTIYEWYIAGLDKEYKKESIYPSVMATWAGIKYAIDNEIETFDFMGAGDPNKVYGVREFKSKFGGELVNYGRYIRINKPVLYFVGKIGLWVYGWVFYVLYKLFKI
ncbi:peptidoglycan bridge formation glycyltransferase FemA/FemB family protein [candidate division KSB1 bacterium]